MKAGRNRRKRLVKEANARDRARHPPAFNGSEGCLWSTNHPISPEHGRDYIRQIQVTVGFTG